MELMEMRRIQPKLTTSLPRRERWFSRTRWRTSLSGGATAIMEATGRTRRVNIMRSTDDPRMFATKMAVETVGINPLPRRYLITSRRKPSTSLAKTLGTNRTEATRAITRAHVRTARDLDSKSTVAIIVAREVVPVTGVRSVREAGLVQKQAAGRPARRPARTPQTPTMERRSSRKPKSWPISEKVRTLLRASQRIQRVKPRTDAGGEAQTDRESEHRQSLLPTHLPAHRPDPSALQ
mmetsp:Transcript_6653/g.20152  ORF Transcript_6653/g.20152 Transcript_6653/m.20152 type:complete len:237 (+) Transcript_6653:2653-3363(+)